MEIIRHSRAFVKIFLFFLLLSFVSAAGSYHKQLNPLPVKYHGWDAFGFSNSVAQAVVVPGIARIMDFHLTGEKNILWQNSKLYGVASDISKKDWQNFGGARLSVAPQSAWGWPPDPILDRGKCEVAINNGALHVQGIPSSEMKVRLDRAISIADTNSVLNLSYTMSNISTGKVSWGIWNVIQIVPGGKIILPYSKGARIWGAKEVAGSGGWKRDDKNGLSCWQKKDGMLVMHHSSLTSKTFLTSSDGWVAYIAGNTLFILAAFDNPLAKYPAGEGNIEIFTCGAYVELEHISPLFELMPDKSVSMREKWYLYKLDKNYTDSEILELIKRILANYR